MNRTKEKNKRPVLQLPQTLAEKVLEVVSASGVFLCFLFLIAYWKTMPERIPTHFGASGIPDGWGGKETLLFLPLGGAFLYMLLTVVSRFPHTFNYPCKITQENAEMQYLLARYLLAFLKAEIIWVFVYIQWMTIQVALGKAVGLGQVFLPLFLVLIFGTIAVYFYKSYRYK